MPRLFQKKDGFDIIGLYSAFLREAEKGYLFAGEAHDFWEMMYCIEGSVIVCSGDRIFELSENQLIFFKPMQFHSFRAEKNDMSKLFISSFKTAEGSEAGLEDKLFDLNQEQKQKLFELLKLLKLSTKSIPKCPKIDSALTDACETKFRLFEIICSLELFLVSLSRSGVMPAQTVNTSEAEIYGEALRAIDVSAYEKLTVDMLAKKCNVSASYLKKIFHKYNGLSIHEYILKNKMSLAKQMLLRGESVTEIAERLGFASQNYLSTAFKRETGLSPTEYRSKNEF